MQPGNLRLRIPRPGRRRGPGDGSMMGREKKSHLENNPTPVPQELGRILRLTATQRYCDGSSTLADSRTGNQPRRAWGHDSAVFFGTGPQPERGLPRRGAHTDPRAVTVHRATGMCRGLPLSGGRAAPTSGRPDSPVPGTRRRHDPRQCYRDGAGAPGPRELRNEPWPCPIGLATTPRTV